MQTEVDDMGGMGLVLKIKTFVFYWQSTVDRRFWYSSENNNVFVVDDFGNLMGIKYA